MNRFPGPFVPVCLLPALALLALTPPAHGCSPVMFRGQQVTIASESALIVYDDKTKTEHFIRRANFRTKVPYFGFLVPTPTQPQLAEVPDDIFAQLEDWTKPEIKVETRIRYRSLLPTMKMAPGSRAVDAMPQAPAGVQVLDQGRVGKFDYAVLKATETKKLQEWLEKHGYDARPQVMAWLDDYIKKEWFITAFQMAKHDEKQAGLNSKAVRMTFQTDRPFYPYREPTDAREGVPAHGSRFLRVFFIGNQRMEGKLDDAKQTWPGRAAWANALDADRRLEMEKRLGEKAGRLPAGAWLTVFDDSSYPRPGTGEVFFAPAASQSPLARPPIIRYQYVERIHPVALIILGVVIAVPVLGFAGVVILVWRLTRRPAGGTS
jgi:hypothetical protein